MKTKAVVAIHRASIANIKPQKVTTSEINNLRTQLEGVKNTSGGLGNGAFASNNTGTLSQLKENIISSQNRLAEQKTSIFANKKGQLADLLKQTKNLLKEDNRINSFTNKTPDVGRVRQEQFVKKADLNNEYKNHTPGLGLGNTSQSRRQDLMN